MSSCSAPQALRPVLLVGVPVAVTVAALLFWLWGGRYVTTENAYVKADIAQVSAEVAGRVLEVHVRDHAEVKAGDLLVDHRSRAVPGGSRQGGGRTRRDPRPGSTLIATWHEALSELQEAESKVAYWNAQMERQKTLGSRHRCFQQVRRGREQRHRSRGPRHRHAQEGRARGGPTRQQSGATGR